MERKNTLEKVAYHEAGHAVSCVEFAIEFNGIEIRPCCDHPEEWTGEVDRAPFNYDKRDIQPDKPPPIGEPCSERRLNEIVVLLAGVAVERILREEWGPVDMKDLGERSRDWQKCRDLAEAVFGAWHSPPPVTTGRLNWEMAQRRDRVATAYLNWKLLQTQALLNSPRLWARVEALARELVRRRRMSADEVRSLLAEVAPA